MPNFNLISKEASIVLVGNFNPTIFHPEWFLRHEIVPEVDVEGAKIEIVHPEITKFAFPWLSIEVLQGKFIARTKDTDHFNPLRDLVMSAFMLLEHSPVSQLGMNLIVDYTVDTEDTWHKIGDLLAPKEVWEQNLPHRVGLLSLRVQSPRIDDLDGNIKVTVEPRQNFGVNVNVNSHVILSEESNLPDILSEHWEVALNQNDKIAHDTIMAAIEG